MHLVTLGHGVVAGLQQLGEGLVRVAVQEREHSRTRSGVRRTFGSLIGRERGRWRCCFCGLWLRSANAAGRGAPRRRLGCCLRAHIYTGPAQPGSGPVRSPVRSLYIILGVLSRRQPRRPSPAVVAARNSILLGIPTRERGVL